MPLIREKLDAGHCVQFSPSGTSMLPMLRQGIDSVILSPLPDKLKKYDLPLYRRHNGQYVLHRIVKTGKTYSCIGDNQYNLENGLLKEQMIALVTTFFRAGKEIRIDNLSYQLYCRFWHYSRPLRHFFARGIGWLRRHFHDK